LAIHTSDFSDMDGITDDAEPIFLDMSLEDIPDCPQTIRASVDHGFIENVAYIKARSVMGFMEYVDLMEGRP
jgi:hypothetical protein